MNGIDLYQKWLAAPALPDDLRDELRRVENQVEEIEDRFYRDLEFGTGGLRGILGAGTNRMNIFTVRKATLGLLRHVVAKGRDYADKGVVIGFDCRRMSKTFSEECARVLAAHGVRAYLFPQICPTPVLSYAVRVLGAAAGIMITASHNPPEYNGYKVYDELGCQVLPEEATEILQQIEGIQDVFSIEVIDINEAVAAERIQYVSDDVGRSYVNQVVDGMTSTRVTNKMRESLSIVYSPLHGTGRLPVRECLQQAGYVNCHIVESQDEPDGEFPTVKSPNPEEKAAFEEALATASACEADVVLATDPDADRVGIAVRDETGEYHLLTGNQTGGLLVNYVLTTLKDEGKIPAGATMVKTIVTSEFGAKIAESYGIIVENTLTGFKYIGNRIEQYSRSSAQTFVFGYEESYGYLRDPFVRDKDAVQICLLVAEMCAYYKSRRMTVLEGLTELYEQVGYFGEELVSVTLPGQHGIKQIESMMEALRREPFHVSDVKLRVVEDYELGVRRCVAAEGDDSQTVEALTLPKSAVLKFIYDDGSWVAVRPSGTEPKIKFYLGVVGPNLNHMASRKQLFVRVIDDYLKQWM